MTTVSPDDCAIWAVTSFELRTGALRSRDPDGELKKVRMAIETLQEAPFDKEAAERSADVRAQLESRGQEIGAYDTLLAGHALAIGLTLVTHNLNEFSRVEGLNVEDWRHSA